MSTTYQAVAFYGVYMGSRNAIEEFFEQRGIQDYNEEIVEGQLGYDCLCASSGDYWVMGIGMELGVPLSFYENIWNGLLPNCDLKPKAILEVKSY